MTTSPTRQSIPDQRQFHQAISRGGNAWYAACVRITRDAALAQDAVQDALLNAWRKRQQFQGGALLETWIHRIAVNSALAAVRRRRRSLPEALAQFGENDPESEQPKPDELVAYSELTSDLNSALDLLSDMERVCFVLKHLEEWRLAEIAEQLNISSGSVKQALFRAIKKLRIYMQSLRET